MSIQPPEEAPKGMGAIIQHIYDQLNRLAGRSVASEPASKTSLTSGESSGGGEESSEGGGDSVVSSIFGAFISGLPSSFPKDVFGVPVPVDTTIQYNPSENAIAKAFTPPPAGTSAEFEILFDNLDGGTTTTTTVGTVEFASGAISGVWTPNITTSITAKEGDELRIRLVTTSDAGGAGFRISLPITLL